MMALGAIFFQGIKWTKNNCEILPSQVGNAKCSAAHWVHLSPTTLALQLHFPLLSSHSIPVEPSALHSHAEKNNMQDNSNFQSVLLVFVTYV